MEDLYTREKVGASGASRLLRVQLPVCDRVSASEVAADVSLPDYQPEIKRLLRVSATAQPPSHYVGGGAMEFSGSVDYCVYYTGNDGQMYCYPTSSEYAFRVPLEAGADFDLNDGLVCCAVCEVENLICRVAGPRRMSVKCRLRAHVKAYASCVIEEKRQSEAALAKEERLLCESETTVCGYAVSSPITISDEILLERGEGEGAEQRIVSGDAQVVLSECSCAGGRVVCHGEAVLKLTLQQDGGQSLPVSIFRKIPFDAQIQTDSATVNGQAVVYGSCTELNLSMEEGRIVCELELLLQARTYRSETVFYTADWYAVGARSECTATEYALPRLLCGVGANFTQSESRLLEELGLGAESAVVDVSGTALIDGVEAVGGKYVLSGKCRYTLILCTDGELSSKEIELPFRYTAQGQNASVDAPVHYEGQVVVLSAKARTDAQRLAVDAELGVWLCVYGENKMSAVSSVCVKEKVCRQPGELILCYPEGGETLWTVAKRYHVALDELSKTNRLGGEHRADDVGSLKEVRVLVI